MSKRLPDNKYERLKIAAKIQELNGTDKSEINSRSDKKSLPHRSRDIFHNNASIIMIPGTVASRWQRDTILRTSAADPW